MLVLFFDKGKTTCYKNTVYILLEWWKFQENNKTEWLAEQGFELRQQRYLDKEKGVIKYEYQ